MDRVRKPFSRDKMWYYNPDMSLPVLAELPDGYQELPFTDPLEAFREFSNPSWYYYCDFCKGWIEGRPVTINEANPLCGRQGRVTVCHRCGSELNFFGVYH